MSVLERKGLAGDVISSELSPDRLDVDRFPTYAERWRMAKAVIVTSFGDWPLRAVQSALSPADMWKRLASRYAGSSTANKTGLLCILMNIRYN